MIAFTFRKVFNIPIWPEFIKSIIQKDKTSIFLKEGFSIFSFFFPAEWLSDSVLFSCYVAK